MSAVEKQFRQAHYEPMKVLPTILIVHSTDGKSKIGQLV